MADPLLDELRDSIAKGQVVVLVGAGVSMGASGGAPVASWTGLLENGVEHCEAVASEDLSDGWGDRTPRGDCIVSLGDIAFARSQNEEARARFEKGLSLYDRLAEPCSIGQTHRRLARIATDDAERTPHVLAAREASAGIDRADLIEELDAEFGGS